MVLRFWHEELMTNRHVQKCSPFFIQKLRIQETNYHHLNKYVLCATRPEKMIPSHIISVSWVNAWKTEQQLHNKNVY